MTTQNHWRIFIDELKVQLPCGINSWEKKGAQEVVVSVEMTMTAENPITSMEQAVDYRRVADYILTDWPQRSHIPLLEQWAEDLVEHCMADRKVEKVMVKLTKTAPYPQAKGVGVELTRSR